MLKSLLFVYNADSGFLNAIRDGIEKVTDPEGYGCRLCVLTYGLATMKGRRRRFLKGLPIESKFLHKDEFIKVHGDGTPLPATFIEEDGELALIISSSEYNELTTLKVLEALLRTRLMEQGII
ncbi:hypothetical protein HN807_09490 [Candidatus Bathyarchaeota archaeon]|nr:hypothetical protein [Candidatus Bathyarchaeota archaeon]MBT4320708.1 hypothetical protein [Candidatus Bathyarchaeota archaeon]MBT6604260.1 hypothetical protein [Candidatus Bathyarchaeota archaeon]MBT7187725.1 hypothetical protein [Candidatus Bathyarchaeota archaeon]MBT7347301.1 hypothetical protein [Candidatus Bathyarchaeota archaeon]